MKKRRGLWAVFAIAVGVVASAMTWISLDLSGLERAQADAAVAAEHDGKVRIALWRMDSWLAPRLVMEASIDPYPSAFKMTFLRKRLDIEPGWHAPAEVAGLRDYAGVRDLVTALQSKAEQLVPLLHVTAPLAAANDLGPRNALSNATQESARHFHMTSGFVQPAGPLLPLWTSSASGEQRLVFVRRMFAKVRDDPNADPYSFADTGKMQVFVADWDVLKMLLLASIEGLLPVAELRPSELPRDELASSGRILASAPIALDAPRPPPAALPAFTPTRVTIGVAWAALAFAFVAVGAALKRTADLSDRRSRFASSVTHELRTPLTTFRLYSEMLADGMVTDAAQRQTYLDTLKSESSRLAALVENVLAYARVEEGRMPVRRERIAVADLLLRVTPPLDRRAKDAGASLRIETGDAASRVVDVDADVVGQILFNLVDNAAKYASISPGREIELNGSVQGDQVRLTVRDHGPGIAPENVRAAFAPFERAGRPPGDAVPGIGLGLALSRALARDLGGDLAYEPASGGGAAFVLTLPVARDAS